MNDKSFFLVAEHGFLQIENVSVDFSKDLSGFIIFFNKNSKINNQKINTIESLEFLEYAAEQKTVMSIGMIINNMSVYAKVVMSGIGCYYDDILDLELLTLETVKLE
jgi:hypothetical protein